MACACRAVRNGAAAAAAPVSTSSFGLEYAVIDASAAPRDSLKERLAALFPSASKSSATDLVIIPTLQKASPDDAADDEQAAADLLTQRFTNWAVAVCGGLSSAGYWCDYVHPDTGLPVMHNETSATFSAADSAAVWPAGGCKTVNGTCCKAVNKGQPTVLRGTVFARAPAAAVREAVEAAEKRLANW